ncbi:hypothetical protein ANACOL_03409 [Anaerotruncus colihominis DSM 17241]|uniref:Uncharacterized protein n=1 Tax=Anaerotruncus colihominis DSM 17241 TaxID=445972 RepID=B0PF30_9FIRM|nr:hypothetical protein ANACOL_03409 [Anaerotruncus colihominis DSM 17241]
MIDVHGTAAHLKWQQPPFIFYERRLFICYKLQLPLICFMEIGKREIFRMPSIKCNI